jgi:serine phosphatase RsbU (regulator of sigma subunit)
MVSRKRRCTGPDSPALEGDAGAKWYKWSVADAAQARNDEEPVGASGSLLRSDALASRQRILAAASALVGDRRVTMTELAAAAKVGRSTLYRHFPTRQAIEQALAELEPQDAGAAGRQPLGGTVTPMPFQAPGQLGREAPLPLDVTRILDEVPPHLVPDQLVAEARRVAGVAIALYVVDIDGSHLLRLAGTEEFPERLEAPPALGPEIVPEGLPEFYDRMQCEFPGCVAEPLWLRGRVTGLLVCVGTPLGDLSDIAKQGAAALELANDYTDYIDAAKRRKPTTPAAEIQQHLFPPRIARIAGAQLAGVLLPSYEVGGDWFDFVENRDGAWLAIADAVGTGPTAAGLGAAALGALRAARRSGEDLKSALTLMDETIRRLDNPGFHMTALLARWRAATATLTWVNCGHPNAYLVDGDGQLAELTAPEHPALGTGSDGTKFTVTNRQLHPGERLILLTDGIIRRRMEGGGEFGTQGLIEALERADNPTAASTAMSIQQAVTDCWREPLEDDATVVVMAID